MKRRGTKGKGKAPVKKEEVSRRGETVSEEGGGRRNGMDKGYASFHSFFFRNSCLLYYLVPSNEAGPSNRRIRRPRESNRDFADLYNRIRSLEANQDNQQQATAASLEEVRQDVDRVHSDVRTHQKYFVQELSRLEERSKERSENLQQQLDSVRDQTRSISDSAVALQKNAQDLTESLRLITGSFQNLRFDIPNILDDWLRLRTGEQSDTVTGEQLHKVLPPLLSSLPSRFSIPSDTHILRPRTPTLRMPTPPAPPLRRQMKLRPLHRRRRMTCRRQNSCRLSSTPSRQGSWRRIWTAVTWNGRRVRTPSWRVHISSTGGISPPETRHRWNLRQ